MPTEKLIKTPELMLQMFDEYKADIKSKPFKVKDWVGGMATEVTREKERPLTMEGFENFVADKPDMPQTLDQYFSNRDNTYEEYIAICSRIRREIRQDQIEGGLSGMYNPSITQRLNGLVEKQENKIQIEEHKITLNLG
jgi:hypothetical protein